MTPARAAESPARRATATCIGCGCTDQRACIGGCHWLRVDYAKGRGVCSTCAHLVAAWDYAHAFGPAHFDLVAHIRRQREYSLRAFGPGQKHTFQESVSAALRFSEGNLYDWAGVILGALDGAWRAGHEPDEIALAVAAHLANLQREGS
jgi:hypothetical protein